MKYSINFRVFVKFNSEMIFTHVFIHIRVCVCVCGCVRTCNRVCIQLDLSVVILTHEES